MQRPSRRPRLSTRTCTQLVDLDPTHKLRTLAPWLLCETSSVRAMGNCYGRPKTSKPASARKANLASDEQEGHDTTDGPHVAAVEERGTRELENCQDQADGEQIVVPEAREDPPTPFNTPAQPNFLLDNALDPNALTQQLTVNLDFLRRIRPDTSRLTRIQFAPADQWTKCAYCDNPAGDRYDYFLCTDMSVELLDELVEKGWWRTGHVIFKPCFSVVCCPGYSMRMPVREFKPNKSHRRVIRKWDKFLRDGDSRWDDQNHDDQQMPKSPSQDGTEEQDAGQVTTEMEERPELVHTAVASAVADTEGVEEGGSGPDNMKQAAEGEGEQVPQLQSRPGKKAAKPVRPGLGPDPSRPPCRKAKQLRAERKKRKLEEKVAISGAPTPSKPQPKSHAAPSLHDLLSVYRGAAMGSEGGYRHKLEVKLLPCNPRSPELKRTLHKAYQLYDKFQNTVHPGKTRFQSASEFEWGFMSSPVRNPPTHLAGSYHMHYYLDDELVMISILDILPKYFVSIYFIYDPDLRFTVPGIFTVLVEIDFIQQLSQERPAPTYFALGYYNHSSPKVNYKKQFKPQEVLCNETNVFIPIEVAIPKLLLKPYVRLVDDEVPEKEGRTAPIENLTVNLNGVGSRPFYLLPPNVQKFFQEPLRQLISEAGSKAAHQFLIEIV